MMLHGAAESPESGPSMRSTYTAGNHLLDALWSDERSALSDDVEVITLPSRRWLAPYGGPRQHVDFPIDAVISIVATLRSGDAIEVGTIGCEGFMETDAALESDTARRGSFCQVSGDVARMPLPRFRERMDENGAFARLMRRSVTATLFNVQQLAACNAKHRVEAQCARWLLMTRDRVGRDSFPVTHESLAVLLGVRRASVSVAAQALQVAGAIVHERGVVTIVGPDALRVASCECYQDCKDASRDAQRQPPVLVST
jgi:CRP-like cAMP-binding protein